MKEYFENNPDNVLIHFTNKMNKIDNILHLQSLNLSYCKEDFSISDDFLVSKAVHPMVCFSEQNLKNIAKKKITYGNYGIAFNPDWIVKNYIQPVIYIEKNSPVAQSLGSLLKFRRRLKKSSIRKDIMVLKCFTKNTIGYNSHFKIKNFLFKEENEWRYVPSKKQIGGGFISENILTFKRLKTKYNKHIKKFPLKFDRISDIHSVFVSSTIECEYLKIKYPSISDKIKLSKWNA